MSFSTGSPAPELLSRFSRAVSELEARYPGDRLADENAENELRAWLNGDDEPLPWTYPDRVTEDEWFFVTTLYGQMTLAGQRSHIRRFFPLLFVEAAKRDIRNFVPGMKELQGLQYPWMAGRLCRMAEVLRQGALTMAEYTVRLQELESRATPENPMPALDTLMRDLRTDSPKTLSVFIRDCVNGNCFPIDSRVRRELSRRGLPDDGTPDNERLLVRLSLYLERNPRHVARMFYEAGER